MRQVFALNAAATVFAMLLASLLSCSNSSPLTPGLLDAQGSGQATTGVGGLQSLGLPTLPAPSSAIAALRNTSAQQLSVYGADFEAGLANQNAAAVDTHVQLSPFGAGDNSQQIADSAFAIYRLNVEGLEGTPTLRLLDGSPNFSSSDLLIGLADWDANTWRFQELPGDVNGPAGIDASNYVSPNFDVLVAVLVLGARSYDLRQLTFNNYDEVEDNDTVETANSLPGGDFSGFRGSIGTGESYPGYDGDAVDVYEIQYQPGSQFRFSYTYDKTKGDLKYSVNLNDGSPFIASDTSATTGNTRISFGLFDSGFDAVTESDFPLYLTIEPLSGFNDYEIDFAIGSPPVASVSADPRNGVDPLAVHFDGSATTDPESDIAFYRWQIRTTDWSVIAPADLTLVTTSPELDYTFESAGLYQMSLSVFDSAGFNGNSSVVVLAGDNPYDEVEDNDAIEQANELDPGKSSGWLGNIGGGSNVFETGPRYDGDTFDFSIINLPLGSSIILSIESLTTDGENLSFGLTNTDGTDDNLERVDVFVDEKKQATQLDTENQRVVISVGTQASSLIEDYQLVWAIGTPPTLEVTPDTTLGAAPLTVNFTTNAQDADGTIERIVWDFVDDDIIQAEGASPSFTFETPGNKFGKAIAFDNDDMRVVTEFVITVT